MTSVTYYNVTSRDNCIAQDPCMVCFEEVTPGQGKAHASSTFGWLSLLKKPLLFHPIHDTCLEVWKNTQLNSNHAITCPTCREPIVDLKERPIVLLNKWTVLQSIVIMANIFFILSTVKSTVEFLRIYSQFSTLEIHPKFLLLALDIKISLESTKANLYLMYISNFLLVTVSTLLVQGINNMIKIERKLAEIDRRYITELDRSIVEIDRMIAEINAEVNGEEVEIYLEEAENL